jgi:ABC-2 type transport system permease protein
MPTIRIALLTIRLVMRTKVALFFTFLFPLVFLFAYSGLIAHGNPEVVAYMFGPVVTLNIMGSGFFGLGIQSVMQRERGSLRRYRLAPIGPRTMLLSNLLANYLLELPTIGLLLFSAIVFFHMPMKIGWVTLWVLVTVGTFAFAGFGLTIASVANTMQEAQVYNNIVWFTLLFLSGVTFPLPMLPHGIQRLAMFFPSTYLVSSFQSITAQAEPPLEHWPEMLVLVASGVFGLLFAMKLFRWEKEERIPTRAKLWSGVFVLPFLIMGLWMNTRANPTAMWARSYNVLGQGSAAASNAEAEEPNVIEDFDGIQPSEELLRRWQVSTDSDVMGQSMAEISLLTPGAEGTRHAMRLKGHLAPGPKNAQGYVSARCEVQVPAQSRGLHGIEFEARGESRVYQVGFSPPKLAQFCCSKSAAPESLAPGPSAAGWAKADATSLPAISFVPGEAWQNVRVPIAWLADPSEHGLADGPWVLEVSVTGPPGEFTLDLDQIRFY